VAAERAAPVKKPKNKKAASSKRDATKRAFDDLAPLFEQLRALQEQARALGLFPNDRELLTCPSCGLAEDVAADGRLFTSHEIGEPDTGLRFIEPKTEGGPFICPECDGEVREPESEFS